jgi:hypothetical protein
VRAVLTGVIIIIIIIIAIDIPSAVSVNPMFSAVRIPDIQLWLQ